jgi:hypothetical protein
MRAELFICDYNPHLVEEAHERAFHELASKFEIPEDRVYLRAGNTVDMLSNLVVECAADLVIIGAIPPISGS